MKYYKKLVGDRIYLSPMCIEDAEKYVEWFCDFRMTDGVGSSSKVMNNIMLNVKSFNERAIACYKKVGFKEFGRRRESYFLNGKYYDDIQMDILSREFEGDYIRNKNI